MLFHYQILEDWEKKRIDNWIPPVSWKNTVTGFFFLRAGGYVGVSTDDGKSYSASLGTYCVESDSKIHNGIAQ